VEHLLSRNKPIGSRVDFHQTEGKDGLLHEQQTMKHNREQDEDAKASPRIS
jgi:hypothetical protein